MIDHLGRWLTHTGEEHALFPLIVFNTLPKSGSVFMVETLCRGLGYEFMAVSDGSFPTDPIAPRKLRKAARGRCLTQEHFDASDHNLDLLRKHSPRIVVHLRDPRQAMLSWIHHVIKLVKDGDACTLEYVQPTPSVELLGQPLTEVIDWHIAHYYIHALAWMERWLEIAEADDSPAVLITTYEKYNGNWPKMVNEILDFYGIPRGKFQEAPVARDSSTHFRVGRSDEFREVFSAPQLQITDELMRSYRRVAELYADKPSSGTTYKKSPVALNKSAAETA